MSSDNLFQFSDRLDAGLFGTLLVTITVSTKLEPHGDDDEMHRVADEIKSIIVRGCQPRWQYRYRRPQGMPPWMSHQEILTLLGQDHDQFVLERADEALRECDQTEDDQ